MTSLYIQRSKGQYEFSQLSLTAFTLHSQAGSSSDAAHAVVVTMTSTDLEMHRGGKLRTSPWSNKGKLELKEFLWFTQIMWGFDSGYMQLFLQQVLDSMSIRECTVNYKNHYIQVCKKNPTDHNLLLVCQKCMNKLSTVVLAKKKNPEL